MADGEADAVPPAALTSHSPPRAVRNDSEPESGEIIAQKAESDKKANCLLPLVDASVRCDTLQGNVELEIRRDGEHEGDGDAKDG